MTDDEVARLRAQAARCLRLANGGLQDHVSRQFQALAIEYLKKAQALERAALPSQQQQHVGHAPPPPPAPSHGVAQQQQQVQPDAADDADADKPGTRNP